MHANAYRLHVVVVPSTTSIFGMKAIIQRVTKAHVSVDGEVIGSIGDGLCVLIGIKRNDTVADINYMYVRKILNTKIFEDARGKKWAASVMDKQYEILCVSQFTLYHALKGNKLDFHRAMPGRESEAFYKMLLAELCKRYKPELIKDGKFGAMMEVSIQNSGPVTIEIESPPVPPASPAADTRKETMDET